MPSVPPPSVRPPVYVPPAPIIYQQTHHRHCSCYENEKVEMPWLLLVFFILVIGAVGLMMLDVIWTLGKERWQDFKELRARRKRQKEWKEKNPGKELPKYPWDIR